MRLVNLSDFGIKSINYYWERRKNFNLSEAELFEVGITGNEAQVDERLIPKLKEANEIFKKYGYEIIIKDAYRSPELYRLVQKKRYENDGKEITDRTLNAVTMPHATGLAVDINLIKLSDGEEVEMWDKADWPEGIFVDYYRDRKDTKSQEYQGLQDLLVDNMLGLGFRIGSKKEFHHFEYKK
ncbi:MAG: hypothetical protein Q7S53_01530 [bacterium]|nr:hypothetical protein [bacterium]